MKSLNTRFSLSGLTLALIIVATILTTYAVLRVEWRYVLGSSDDEFQTLWADFCDELKKAGAAVEFYTPDENSLDRAEGYRYLSRILRLSLLSELEHYDAERPVIWESETPVRKFGGNNPDELYYDAFIDGTKTYRITGARGTTPLIEMTVYEGRLRSGERGKHVSHLTEQTLAVNDDGSLEVTLGPNPQPGNWLKTTPESNFLYIRQYRFDWESDQPAQLKIELLDDPGPPEPLRLDYVRERLMAAARDVDINASFWAKLARLGAIRANNKLADPIIPGSKSTVAEAEDATLPKGHILQPGYFDLEPDEALVIEFTPPEELAYWGFALVNRWYESLDYRYHQAHSNSLRAVPDNTGKVKLIVARSDPGLPNWVDTAGHREGTMIFRWTRPLPETKLPEVSVMLVKIANLVH